YAHQDLPFERLVHEISPRRDLSRTPIFQVLFTLQTAPAASARRAPARAQGLKRRGLEVPPATAKFDLSLYLVDGPRGIDGTFEYATDLFDASTVDRLAASFVTLLEGIAASPSRPVGDLPVLPASERERVLTAWNAPCEVPRPEATLHRLFEAQVNATPDAIALDDHGERMTYRDLDRQANRMARLLRARGVEKETLVGLCVHRSAAMVAAILAVLKAGAAYVPLDPAYPRQRLAQILHDSAAPVVIAEARARALLPEGAGLVLLDGDAGEIAAQSDARLPDLATPSSLAYVIYTSGSTGRPKGVAIEHRSTACLVAWAKRVFSPDDARGVLFCTSICFDLSLFELFLPLGSGTTVILADNALELPSLPARGEVTLVNTVPSAIAELVRAGGLPASVRTVCLAGEPLTAALAAQVYAVPTVERVY